MGKIPLYDWWHKWFSKRNNERFIDREEPIPVILVNTMGSAGQTLFGADATHGPPMSVVEDNSSSISSITGVVRNNIAYTGNRLFGATGSTVSANHQHRYFQTTLTATAGGEIVAADVGPPTLASNQACMIITHIYSDQTIANATTTFAASAGGLAVGLASLDITTVANAIAPDWSPGLAWQADTDAATLQVSAAAGQYGNAQNVTFCGVYWYET